ncbi:DUF4261 domain-containing protein [Balamuthia mandrillaris]
MVLRWLWWLAFFLATNSPFILVLTGSASADSLLAAPLGVVAGGGQPTGWPQSAERVSYSIASAATQQHQRDVYQLLTEEELTEWALLEAASPLNVSQRLNKLRLFEEKVFVNVVLVGFSGDGQTALSLSEKELSKYLDVIANAGERVTVVNPLQDGSSGAEHELPIQRRYFFEVTKSDSSLLKQIESVLSTQLEQGGPSTTVPYSAVDSLVAQDAMDRDSALYTIYLLNPKKHRKWYAYSQQHPQEQQQSESVCPITYWVSNQGRYLWVDLSAGPLDYGPQTTGDGLIIEADMPSLERFAKQSDNVQAATMMMAQELAAFVRRTARLLIGPSMWHTPLPTWWDPFANSWRPLRLQLIYIHDHLVDQPEKYAFFNYAAIYAQVQSIPLLQGQQLLFSKSDLSLLDNSLCASLYVNSIKTHTSTVVRDNVRAKVHQYLDSKELHHWLSKYRKSLFETLRVNSENVFPVFLFDVSYTDILLLDRYYQAVSFPDMIIAVQTPSPRLTFDYACDGQEISLDPRDASRPVLATLLQSIWGVSPTHISWDVAHSRKREDFLWSLGNTPFGPFSTSILLSFAQKDASVRHHIYAAVNQLLSNTTSLLQLFSSYHLELEDVLSTEAYIEFVRRWNLFMFKLSGASTALSMQQFNQSLAFLQSSNYDLARFRSLLSTAGGNVHSFLECSEDVGAAMRGGRGTGTGARNMIWGAPLYNMAAVLSCVAVASVVGARLLLQATTAANKRKRGAAALQQQRQQQWRRRHEVAATGGPGSLPYRS